MNIFPLHSYEPKDRPWVVRLLRYIGYLVVILSTLSGFTVLQPIVAANLPLYYFSNDGMYGISVLLGGILGLLGGFIVSVPYWGLAMLLDDIHAIRVQSSAYVTVDKKNG